MFQTKTTKKTATEAVTTVKTTPAPRPYRRPQFFLLGNLEAVQAYYTGRYRDGPNSSYWYNG